MDWHSGMNILLLLHTKTDVSFRALGTLVYSILPLIERCQLAIVFPPGVVVFALNLMNSSEVSARASWFVLGLKNKIPSPPLFQREQASQTRGPSSGLCSAGALMRSFDNSSPAASTTWHVVWERRGGRPALKERFGTSSRMIGKFRTISRQTMVGGPKENPDKIILLLLQPPCCVCVS
jgi:hypothetical protein